MFSASPRTRLDKAQAQVWRPCCEGPPAHRCGRGRTALLMRSAGPKTLTQKLKEDGRLSLGLLQRFGEELLEAVNYLEDQGVGLPNAA